MKFFLGEVNKSTSISKIVDVECEEDGVAFYLKHNKDEIVLSKEATYELFQALKSIDETGM